MSNEWKLQLMPNAKLMAWCYSGRDLGAYFKQAPYKRANYVHRSLYDWAYEKTECTTGDEVIELEVIEGCLWRFYAVGIAPLDDWHVAKSEPDAVVSAEEWLQRKAEMHHKKFNWSTDDLMYCQYFATFDEYLDFVAKRAS